MVKAAWPAIIDKALFQRAKVKLDLNSVDRPSGKTAAGRVYLLDATRVVCANTLGVALGERGGASWRIQRSASAKEGLEEAGKAFRRIAQSYETFGELANVMAMWKFTPKQMQATVDGILPVLPDDKDHRRLLVKREKVQRLYETAVEVERLRGTAWGAFQSWTEYADHHRALRDTGR